MSVNLEGLQSYLRVIRRSFEKNENLIEFVDNICEGNVRLALDYIRAFIGSGHVDTAKILNIFKDTGDYTIPLHEFLRAVIYGEHEYYDPAQSEIVNLFDICSTDGREHFLMLIILAQVDRWGQLPTSSGYVSRDLIIEFCQDLGFQLPQVEFSLKRSLSKKLIETHTKNPEIIHEEIPHYRLTSVGAYYHKKLASMFQYVDAMIVDTPIIESEVRENIHDAQTISDRLERILIFIKYLRSQWTLIATDGLAFDFSVTLDRLVRDIDTIRRRLLMVG